MATGRDMKQQGASQDGTPKTAYPKPQAEAQVPTGEGEWTVTTPYPDYDGITAKVQFRGGRAVVYSESIARTLSADFGYRVSPPLRSLGENAPPAPENRPPVRVPGEEEIPGTGQTPIENLAGEYAEPVRSL